MKHTRTHLHGEGADLVLAHKCVDLREVGERQEDSEKTVQCEEREAFGWFQLIVEQRTVAKALTDSTHSQLHHSTTNQHHTHHTQQHTRHSPEDVEAQLHGLLELLLQYAG